MQTWTHTEDVVIRQGSRRVKVTATLAEDVTGASDGWVITYRMPQPEVMFDEAEPLEVVVAGGGSGRFVPMRKIGRARLGVGMGQAPHARDATT